MRRAGLALPCFTPDVAGGRRTGAFPECCLIGRRVNSRTRWFASGVLVHERIVLTAAHLYDSEAVANVVAVGATDRDLLKPDDPSVFSAHDIEPHPDYRPPLTGNDIAVMIVKEPARVNNVKPADIATLAEVIAARGTVLVGFGDDRERSGFGIKRVVTADMVSVQPSPGVRTHDEKALGFDSLTEFVAGGDGKGTCAQDSGGPAYVPRGGGLALAGITSRSAAGRLGAPRCGGADIYTMVAPYREFIRGVAQRRGISF